MAEGRGAAFKGATRALSGWAGVLLRALGIVAALVLIYGYVQKVDRENEARDIQRSREICELVKLLDDPDAPPPSNPRAAKIAEAMHRYRQGIGCDQR